MKDVPATDAYPHRTGYELQLQSCMVRSRAEESGGEELEVDSRSTRQRREAAESAAEENTERQRKAQGRLGDGADVCLQRLRARAIAEKQSDNGE